MKNKNTIIIVGRDEARIAMAKAWVSHLMLSDERIKLARSKNEMVVNMIKVFADDLAEVLEDLNEDYCILCDIAEQGPT